MGINTRLLWIILLAVWAGCKGAPNRGETEKIEDAPGSRATLSPPLEEPAPVEARRFTLEAVRARILGHATPHLGAEAFRPVEARGRADEAGLWPNPYVLVRKREVDDDDLFSSGMTEVEIGQPIELGGKRGARAAHASAEAETAFEALGALTLRTLRDAEVQFYRVLGFQEDLAEARVEASTAEKLEALAAARFQAGKDSRIAVLRFQAAAETARLAVQDLTSRHASACRGLDDLLGVRAGTTAGVEGDWKSALLTEAEAQAAREALAHHPRRRVADRAVAAADLAVDRAGADAWPDLTLGLAYERSHEKHDNFLGFMVKVPMPLLDRNQGDRAAARAAARRARKALEAETLKLSTELEAALVAYDRSAQNAAGFADNILPRLEQSLALTRSAYEAGKASYLDVLDSLLTLIRTRRERLGHLVDRARAVAEVQYLAGGE